MVLDLPDLFPISQLRRLLKERIMRRYNLLEPFFLLRANARGLIKVSLHVWQDMVLVFCEVALEWIHRTHPWPLVVVDALDLGFWSDVVLILLRGKHFGVMFLQLLDSQLKIFRDPFVRHKGLDWREVVKAFGLWNIAPFGRFVCGTTSRSRTSRLPWHCS